MAADDSGMPSKRTWSQYATRLFHNVYNYSIIGGVTAVSMITHQYWMMLGLAGAEGLWLIYAPDSKRMRNALDMVMDDEEAGQRSKSLEASILGLSRPDQVRCRALIAKQAEITNLANQNNAFTRELLSSEMGKLQKLVDSFIELATTTARYRDYLDREDVGDLDRLAKSYEREAGAAPDGPVKDLAKKNQKIVLSRLERLKDIKQFVDRAGGQLELIENSFGLLADQIVSMRSPGELSDQLDELLDGVEAVRETAKEADQMLATEPA